MNHFDTLFYRALQNLILLYKCVYLVVFVSKLFMHLIRYHAKYIIRNRLSTVLQCIDSVIYNDHFRMFPNIILC